VPPTASFSASCSGLTCTFTDASSDDDGSIRSHSWSFGDGNASIVQNPTHTYGSGGTYTVTLTVTDDDNATATAAQSVSVTGPSTGITLTVDAYKVKGRQQADLTWGGAGGDAVVIYRDGALIESTPNDGAYTDSIGARGGGSYTYMVCETGQSAACSPEVVASY
jgi:serine protease